MVADVGKFIFQAIIIPKLTEIKEIKILKNKVFLKLSEKLKATKIGIITIPDIKSPPNKGIPRAIMVDVKTINKKFINSTFTPSVLAKFSSRQIANKSL